MYELTVEDHFSAAHNLRGYQGECEKLHGHNWLVQVRVQAEQLDKLEMVVDFRELRYALKQVLGPLDHAYLNDVPPFDEQNPTTENMCRYIAEALGDLLPEHVQVQRVTCWESEKCSASYVP
ncbi:MAG: 6-carboxytetrahydropterin synthase QueD [Candidatus Brocadiia bacterium]